jgi:glycine cleavage system aminomethyltransferase T/glycine/D-amino acid oxidase-like deaminating enzyme
LKQPTSAAIVIIGSGIAGASIAYHLTQLGRRDVVVLEQGALTSGTTAHAPGLVGQLRGSVGLTQVLLDSVALYRDLRLDGEAGYFPVGSLRLASSPARLEEIKRQDGFARGVGLQTELISTSEALARFPLMDPTDVLGALFLPTDGAAKAVILATALRRLAEAGGARFYADNAVTNVEVARGRVSAVVTKFGRIETETLVVAAGVWSPVIGRMAGVTIPLLPMQHQYERVGPLPELAGNVSLPNLRDPDRLVYFRQDGDSLVIGGYERDPVSFNSEAIGGGSNPTVRSFDASRFAALRAASIARVPALADKPTIERINGLESFTPDGEFILGPAAEVGGFWVACGFCAHGVSGSGGVGKAIAEWIVNGEPSYDLWHMDIRRFGAHAASRSYVADRVNEVYATYYDITYPGDERSSQRGLRLSPLYARLVAQGAVFGEKSGWERGNWFACNESEASRAAWPTPVGWAGKNWSSAIAVEHMACRERVALFDESSFSKLIVEGPAALAFLQSVASNQLDQPIGAITYTQLLDHRGGIQCDLTVTRRGPESFMIVTGTAFGQHDLAWLKRHQPAAGVTITDATSAYVCIGMWGPRARDLLAGVTESDVSNEAFPYLTAQRLVVGAVAVMALRVTYVGELGWELYAASEYGQALWDTLWRAGQPLGVVAAGYRAIDSLRLEKGYRYWSSDIHAEYTPYEAGLGFAVKLDKGDFIGRDALVAAKATGLTRKLCCLVLSDSAAFPLGGEPIWATDPAQTEPLGRVTSGGYGYAIKKSLAYGYLPIAQASVGTVVMVQLFGERVQATVTKEPLYDPTNARIKA